MSSTTSIVALHNQTNGFCEGKLVDNSGRSVIGIYCMKLAALNINYKEEFAIPKVGILCASIFSSFKTDNNGRLVQRFSPLQMVELKGEKNFETVVNLSHVPPMSFSDQTVVHFWMQSIERKQIKGDNFKLVQG